MIMKRNKKTQNLYIISILSLMTYFKKSISEKENKFKVKIENDLKEISKGKIVAETFS